MRNGWVVPPLRRLSSIAYGVHSPLVPAHHDEVDREPAERALLAPAARPIVSACWVIGRAYSGAAGNVQPR